MSHANRFLASQDEERRLARRAELKRELAALAVKRERVAELSRVVAALDADSDARADEHSAAAGRLQTELAELDSKHVDAILAGRSLAAAEAARRAEILGELAKLNAALELACEANKRAASPIRREIEKLRAEVATHQAVENRLRDLASAEVRQRAAFASLLNSAVELMAGQADRRVGIAKANVDICEANGDTTERAIHEAKLADWQAVLAMVGDEAKRARSIAQEATREAIAE